MKQMTGDGQLCTMLLHQTWIESKNSLAQISFGGMTGERGGFAKFSTRCLMETVNEESLSPRPRGVRIASSLPRFSHSALFMFDYYVSLPHCFSSLVFVLNAKCGCQAQVFSSFKISCNLFCHIVQFSHHYWNASFALKLTFANKFVTW